MKTIRTALLGMTFSGLLFAGTALRAEVPCKAFYLGGFGGGNVVLSDWDLSAVVDVEGPGSSSIMGLRAGFQLFFWLGIEAGVGSLPTESTAGAANKVVIYNGDLLLYPFEGNWVPFLDLGAGGYQNLAGDLGSDIDFQFHYGLGLRGMLNDWIAVRLDARQINTDGNKFSKPPRGYNLEFTAGLDFFVWEQRHRPEDTDGDGIADKLDDCPLAAGGPRHRGCPDRDKDDIQDALDLCPDKAGLAALKGCPDRDQDGVRDSQDVCPSQAGKKEFKGCPDRDDDGIQDSVDVCPDHAGKPEHKGCPDKDGDGIIDRDDHCPKEKGTVERKGCPEEAPPPDRDRDGVVDDQDRCPDQAGMTIFKGCPDKDKDTVVDLDDRCPEDAGPEELKGCPDRDSDGVADLDDKCPDQAGVPKEQGCLPFKLEKKFKGSIQGILFKSGKAELRAESRPFLDEAVKILKEHQDLKLRIEGHTDSVGSAAINLKLSQERAQAVRSYLIEKGIEADRLRAVGLGESQPIADNKTIAGRAANRRIEFEIEAK